MHIFLDANILFSAAKSAGAIRQLLGPLNEKGRRLVADDASPLARRHRATVRRLGNR